MFHLLGKIPREPFAVACSGGIDSMVLVNFLQQFPKNRFKLMYFNHGTKHGSIAETFLRGFSNKNGIPLEIGRISREKPKNQSPEEFWRTERYEFLDTFKGNVLTAHNLNDCVETWLFSSFRGVPKIIPYARNNIIRPFLMVSKDEIRKWADEECLTHVEDPSNECTDYTRNLIRHELMPIALKVNPGIENMLRRMILKRGI